MKCGYYQRKKQNRTSNEAKKKLSAIVNDFMAKSIVVGPEQALEEMKKEEEK